MGNLLFNPTGRIQRNRFWQGMVILTVASVLVVAGNSMVGPLFGLLGLVLIYPYICVYGKRLHDAGTTAWWVIAIWVGSLIISFIIGLLFAGVFMTEELLAIQEEAAERLATGDFAGFMEGTEIISKELLPLNIIATVGSNAILAGIVGMLATQPKENKHGPVPGTAAADTFS